MNIFLHSRKTVSVEENRTLAAFPQFSAANLKSGDFFKGIDEYYTDHFMFRNKLIKVNHFLSGFKGFTGEDEVEIVTVNNENQYAEDPDNSSDGSYGKDSGNSEDLNGENPAGNNEEDLKNNEDQGNNEDPGNNEEGPVELEPAKTDNEEDETENNNETSEKPVEKKSRIIEKRPDVKIKEVKGAVTKSSNIFIQNGTAYEIFGYSKDSCRFYADALNDFADQLPEKMKVFSLVAPTHTEFMQNKKYREMNDSQDEAIKTIDEELLDRITPVNAINSILPHYNEYIYFRSDHHWTARGAYYAYEAFDKAAGFKPVPLDKFEVKKFPGFLGTLYDKTMNRKIAEKPDTVEVFMPIVKSSFAIHTKSGAVLNWNIINQQYGKPSFKNKYLVFMSGDEPLSIIKTDADSDKKLLVFKDSFGNAFIPFLMNHYKEIHVIDPRYYKGNAVEYAKKGDFDHVLFINSAAVVSGNTNFAKNIMRITNEKVKE